MNKFSFPKGKSIAAPSSKPAGEWDPSVLKLAEHKISFSPGADVVPEEHYKTLLDVKDLSSFQEDYFAPHGRGLPSPNGRALHKQMSLQNVNTGGGGSGGEGAVAHVSLHRGVGSELDSNKSTTSALSRPLSTLELKRPPSLQLTAGARVQKTLKRPQSMSGLGVDAADWDVGKGPGGGLPPLRGSSFRAPAPVLVHVDDSPAYVKALRKTGTYLKEQFGKAKEQLMDKLPRMESSPSLSLQTGKERFPPKPTANNGFSRQSAPGPPGTPGQGGQGEAEAEEGKEEDPGKAPFSLLSSAMRASSFMSGLRIKSPDQGDKNVSSSEKPVYEGNENLSQRHKSMMIEASPGHGLPVIYAPQTARSEVSEASLYSHVTSITNMLEVSDGQKRSPFKPASMKHLDLGKVAEVPEHQHEDVASHSRIPEAAEVGPELPEKDIGGNWRACWDFSAESVYYFNTESGEATWIPPPRRDLGGGDGTGTGTGTGSDAEDEENFYRISNNGLPRGMSELNLGDSELTIKTRKIAARHNLFSKLRSRYEGDTETEYTKGLIAKEYAEHAAAEENEIVKDYGKELEGWDGD